VGVVSRLPTVVLIAAVAVAAIVLPAPDPEPEPLSGVVIDRPGIESPIDAAIWYCPWAQSTTIRDSLVSIMSIGPATAEMTFPVVFPGEAPDVTGSSMGGPGAATIVVSDVARRGDSPGFIEFAGGPSGASVTVTGDVTAVDTCVARGGDEWFFVGGSTMTGDELRLRLFNPFPETARVSVSAFSEIGVEALGALASTTVNARSFVDVTFPEVLRQRQSLVVSVRLERGLVIPAMSFGRGDDEAWWSGTGLSTDWELPIVRLEREDAAHIVVANPGLASVSVEVELYGPSSSDRETHFLDVPAGAPGRIDLSDFASPVVGARISADAPVAAGVVTIGPSGTAVTAGSPQRARAWLLPGARSTDAHAASLWLLNTSEDAIIVTVSRITDEEVFNVNEVLEPGAVTRLPVIGSDGIGYLVRSADPFTAAWSLLGESGLGLSAGIMVPEDE
jgi:hypothetical protein